MMIYVLILILIVYLLSSKTSKDEGYETPKIFCNYYSEKEDKVVYGEVEPEKCQIPPLRF